MLRFLSITFLMIGFSVIILTAQDKYPSGSNVDETSELIIPIHVLLQNAMSGRITWQPDWPSSIPVDAFNILNDEWAHNVSAVTLLNGNIKLTARRDEQGLFTEFPVFMNGIFYQFKTRFDSKGRISGFAMDGESPIEIEFLAFENADGKPSLARIRNGGVWLFASLLDQNGLSLETWYDAGGTPLAVFSAQSENGQVRFYKYAIQSSPEEMGNAPQTDKSPNITAPSGTKVPTIVMAPGSIV
ncbi:MAG: hypothetical protein LBH18_01670, partial [Spirochaetaceae bacterium]|nr:hypothetical protein [Spirochaetaceae bacterium]